MKKEMNMIGISFLFIFVFFNYQVNGYEEAKYSFEDTVVQEKINNKIVLSHDIVEASDEIIEINDVQEHEASEFNIVMDDHKKAIEYTIEDILEDALILSDEVRVLSLSYELINQLSEDVILTYDSSQKFDYAVYNSRNEEIYRMSKQYVYFLPVIGNTVIKPKDKLVYKHSWNYCDNNGMRIPDGKYTIVFRSSFEYKGNRMSIEEQAVFILGDVDYITIE